MSLDRDAAWQLLQEWTTGESLRKHALAVEAAVRGYARQFGEDEADWSVVALLHDFDYERYPTADDHPFRGCEELARRGYPAWVTEAILSHASYSGVPRRTLLHKTLFACDEMAGFVMAAALVRPDRSILTLTASSVLKRMKDKAFARAVSRDDLRTGAAELGIPLEEHVTNVITFLRGQAAVLGLSGPNDSNPSNESNDSNRSNDSNDSNDSNRSNDSNPSNESNLSNGSTDSHLPNSSPDSAGSKPSNSSPGSNV